MGKFLRILKILTFLSLARAVAGGNDGPRRVYPLIGDVLNVGDQDWQSPENAEGSCDQI